MFFPHVSSLPCSNLNLISADGSPIRSWGTKIINLQFGKRRVSCNFRLADVKFEILGADFLAKKDLLVDISRFRLLGTSTLQPFTNVLNVSDPINYTANLSFRLGIKTYLRISLKLSVPN